MPILPDGLASSTHDPLVCGLDLETDCSACRRARLAKIDRLTPSWLRLWNQIRKRFHLVRRGTGDDLGPDQVSAPLSAFEVARLVRTLCDPAAAQPIVAALAAELFALARQAVRAELQAERGYQ
jgi:hypothetical protein